MSEVSSERHLPSLVISLESSASHTDGLQRLRTALYGRHDSEPVQAPRPVEGEFAGIVGGPPCLEVAEGAWSTGPNAVVVVEVVDEDEHKEERRIRTESGWQPKFCLDSVWALLFPTCLASHT